MNESNESIKQRIAAVIESVPQPEFVASLSFHLAEDWSGDPAVMILVLLKDGEKSDNAYLDRVNHYKHMLLDAVVIASTGYLPYATFRLESEQTELDRDEAETKAKLERRRHRKTAVAA
ncbi:hypothetical protein [Armatimonas sp.]|uniref:hypothetical protein n=1 Tax=Armatimonas sp. TaxID=1872638 RepID=UPI00286D43B6|nr:hypothetical protein [Armatimonas sp.]